MTPYDILEKIVNTHVIVSVALGVTVGAYAGIAPVLDLPQEIGNCEQETFYCAASNLISNIGSITRDGIMERYNERR